MTSKTGERGHAACFLGVLSALGLASALISPAAAQVEFEPKVKMTQRDLGLTVKPTMRLMYDDNLFRVDEDVEKASDDFILSPGVELELNKLLGPHKVQASARADYDIYAQHGSLNRLRLDASLGGQVQLGGICYAEPYARYRRARADYGDINSRAKNLQEFLTLTMLLSCQKEAGFYPVAKIQRDTTSNDEAFDYSDRKTMSYAAGIGFSRPSLGDVTLYYERENTDRPASDIKNNVNRYGVTFTRAVVSHVSFNIDLHWVDVKANIPGVPNYHNLAWDASTILSPSDRLQLRLETSRTIVTDSLVAVGYIVQSDYMGRLTYRFPGGTYAGVGYAYRFRDFRNDPLATANSINSDKSYAPTIFAGRKISEKIDLTLVGMRDIRRTNTGERNYRANQVMLTANYDF